MLQDRLHDIANWLIMWQRMLGTQLELRTDQAGQGTEVVCGDRVLAGEAVEFWEAAVEALGKLGGDSLRGAGFRRL